MVGRQRITGILSLVVAMVFAFSSFVVADPGAAPVTITVTKPLAAEGSISPLGSETEVGSGEYVKTVTSGTKHVLTIKPKTSTTGTSYMLASVTINGTDITIDPVTGTATGTPDTDTLTKTGTSWKYTFGNKGTPAAGVTEDMTVSVTFAPLPLLTVETSGNGTVTSTPSGIKKCGASTGSVCEKQFNIGKVTLAATPATGYTITADSWDGCTPFEKPDQTIDPKKCVIDPLSEDTTVTVTFISKPRLTVAPSSGGKVSSKTKGIKDCKSTGGTCSATFDGGAIVLIATPDTGYTITSASWGEDVCTTLSADNKQCTIDFSADQTVDVTFISKPTLTVVPSEGGKVSTKTKGIKDCKSTGGTCSGKFDGGSIVLIATPDTGYTIASTSWGEDVCTVLSADNKQCTIDFSADQIVEVAFISKPILTLEVSENGTVSSDKGGINNCGINAAGDPTGVCTKAVDSGAIVLTAKPAAGYAVYIDGWEGDCEPETANVKTDQALKCTATITDTDANVYVTFVSLPVVTVTTTGTGTVTCAIQTGQTGWPAAVSSGTSQYKYAMNTPLVCTASGGTIEGWSGCDQDTTNLNKCSLTLIEDTSVSASFAAAAASGSALKITNKVASVEAKTEEEPAVAPSPSLKIAKSISKSARLIHKATVTPPDCETAAGKLTAYCKDKTQYYVEDTTGQVFDTVNEILCMMGQTRYDVMLNKPTYIAMVDKTQCSSKKDDASQSGQEAQNQSSGSTSVEYEKWTVNSSRTGTNPQIVKAWIHQTEKFGEGMEIPIVINARVTIKDGMNIYKDDGNGNMVLTDTDKPFNPYGIFTVDFEAKASMMDMMEPPVTSPSLGPGGETALLTETIFKGQLKSDYCSAIYGAGSADCNGDDNAIILQFVNQAGDAMTAQNMGFSQKAALKKRTADTGDNKGAITGGAGTVEMSDPGMGSQTLNLAYDDNYVYGGNGNGEICLSRTETNKTAWRYGLYDSATGGRVVRNSGFLQEDCSGCSGYARDAGNTGPGLFRIYGLLGFEFPSKY